MAVGVDPTSVVPGDWICTSEAMPAPEFVGTFEMGVTYVLHDVLAICEDKQGKRVWPPFVLTYEWEAGIWTMLGYPMDPTGKVTHWTSIPTPPSDGKELFACGPKEG